MKSYYLPKNQPYTHAFGLLTILFAFLYSMTFSEWLSAADNLDVSVDKSQMYQNETLEMRVIGNIEFEFNMGTIFNLRNLELPEPEVGTLDQDFEILNRTQQYSVKSINGNNTAEITWTYTLAPKKAGRLTIPEITFKSAKSNPIDIEVLTGSPKKGENQAPPIFLELVVDKTDAYVQEQVVVSLRLYHQGNLASGELTKPEPADTIVEPLGEQTKYSRMKFNRRYEVIERNYLLFPQKSGQLTIAPQTFSGTLIDPAYGRRRFAREVTEEKQIKVKPQPNTFSGASWLPAMSLHLTEEWSDDTDNIRVGDSVTRTISLQALGLLGSALPSFKMDEPSGIKLYPDQEQRNSEPHKAGASSTLTQSFAFVAVKPGKVTLPSIEITWWDTVNDVQRTTRLPERVIEILPSADQQVGAPQALNSQEKEAPTVDLSNTDRGKPLPPELSVQPIWFWLFIGMTILWLATIVFFIARQKSLVKRTLVSHNAISDNTHSFKDNNVSLKAVITSAKAQHPNTLNLLIDWCEQLRLKRAPQMAPIVSIKQIYQLFTDLPELASTLKTLEAQLYGQAPQKPSERELISLQKAMENLQKTGFTKDKTEASRLPDFYPE